MRIGTLFYHQNRVVSPSTVITHYPAHEPRMNRTRTAHEHAEHIMCIVAPFVCGIHDKHIKNTGNANPEVPFSKFMSFGKMNTPYRESNFPAHEPRMRNTEPRMKTKKPRPINSRRRQYHLWHGCYWPLMAPGPLATPALAVPRFASHQRPARHLKRRGCM